jgi:hypothetical protein
MKKGTHVIVTIDSQDNEAEYLNSVGTGHHLVRLFPAFRNGQGPSVSDKGLRTVDTAAIRLQEIVMP